VAVFDRVFGGAPFFGISALDETIGSRLPMVIHNGTAYHDRQALLLIWDGALESRFRVESLPGMNFYSQPALVTEARGSKLISINNMPAAEFMEKIGIISTNNKINAFYAFPLLIDNHDGAGPNPYAVHAVGDDGVLNCGSALTTGATLQLVNQLQENVFRSSGQIAETLKKEDGGKNHLIVSCFGRSMPLVDLRDEMRLFQKQLEGMPYLFIYSGGEFCPIYDKQSGMRNGFYQFSVISVSF
jgi:hypothetical protein